MQHRLRVIIITLVFIADSFLLAIEPTEAQELVGLKPDLDARS